MAFTAYGFALILARTFVGHLPDRFGGARVALIFGLGVSRYAVSTARFLFLWSVKELT